MSQNVLAKLTSRKWLREAFVGRARNLANSFNFVPVTMEREVAGEKYQFYIGSVTGKSWYGTPVDASLEMKFVKDRISKPGDVVIECGAHHGAQTILLSRWAGSGGHVVAIEPEPENISILRKNVEINHLANVTVINKAAGERAGSIAMKAESNGQVAVNASGRNIVQVEVTTLDQVARELGLKPTFIKIDVEGFEYDVLAGSREILATVPAVFVEVHTLSLPRYGRKFEDIWNYIDPKLYDIFIQAEDDEPPVPYSPSVVPGGRVHLFFLPRQSPRAA